MSLNPLNPLNPHNTYDTKGNHKDHKDHKESQVSKYKRNYRRYRQEFIDAKFKPPNLSHHLKISIRLPKGIVTSLTIKKNIIALWLLYTSDPDYLDIDAIADSDKIAEEEIDKVKGKINKLVTDFVYKCLEDWDKDTGKGLSDFVTELMIKDFLDDYTIYSVVLPLI